MGQLRIDDELHERIKKLCESFRPPSSQTAFVEMALRAEVEFYEGMEKEGRKK